MWNKSLLILCASSVIRVATSANTCQDTTGPYSYNIKITCTNNTNLLPKFAKEVSFLECLDCNIPVLDNTTVLINFRGETFNMSNSRVRKIHQGAFNTFKKDSVRSFIFANNEIDYIQPKLFNNFSVIDLVDLQNCQITSLESKVFEGTRLVKLDLSLNHLSSIRFAFVGLKVNKLDLSGNRIRELPEDTFEKMTFWEANWKNQVLDLSNNLIEKLIPNTFKTSNETNRIVELYIDQNSISVIEDYTFSKLRYLEMLSLQNNKISILNKDAFEGLTNLAQLVLSKNSITNIPFGLFKYLARLERLDLSNNRLSTLSPNTFSGLIVLNTLNISNNDLKFLEPSHLLALGRLVSLDVSATKLRNLKLQEIIQHLFRLRTLVINDNFWTCKQLMEMYQLLNDKLQGFNNPSRRYDVSNLHGIACSRGQLKSYDNLSFDDFLKIISNDDSVFEDTTISSNNDVANNTNTDIPYYSDIDGIIKKINSLYWMFIILTVIAIIVFIHYVLKYVVSFLRNRNIVGNNNFVLFYAQREDDVNIIP